MYTTIFNSCIEEKTLDQYTPVFTFVSDALLYRNIFVFNAFQSSFSLNTSSFQSFLMARNFIFEIHLLHFSFRNLIFPVKEIT